ncbi:MAG: DUF4167 domain-containing protein, partial [Sulfitobacter litoralis]|nr:DUF4167 domain-containing protein [Sulfitobacter litoralis]
MKSSRSRSRSKNTRNRQPQGGNVVNRVFDSSGPEGKVRGTPQQIIEKYNQLARDAHLSNDRVAAENFQQHAEHYLRMLSEAQREIDQRRDQQERENRERQAERDRERVERQEREAAQGGQNNADQPAADADTGDKPDSQQQGNNGNADAPKRRRPRSHPNDNAPKSDSDGQQDGDAPEDNLVETPENKPKPRR